MKNAVKYIIVVYQEEINILLKGKKDTLEEMKILMRNMSDERNKCHITLLFVSLFK
jgi:hypothetical protein